MSVLYHHYGTFNNACSRECAYMCNGNLMCETALECVFLKLIGTLSEGELKSG